MSARFFRIFSGTFLAHVVVFGIVWVGFSAPFPRPPATFTYEGALPSQDTGTSNGDVWQNEAVPDQFVLDPFKASHFNHWIELRGPAK